MSNKYKIKTAKVNKWLIDDEIELVQVGSKGNYKIVNAKINKNLIGEIIKLTKI
jgi:hypothetical protein